MSLTTPVPLGLKRSFGFGDRLGLATPGHLRSLRGSDFAPIFAQQSIREMTRTQRTPDEVMSAAAIALEREAYTGDWGADADHLKTPEDVERTALAGFRFFTIDPSEYVNNGADSLTGAGLRSAVAELEKGGSFPDPKWREYYLKEIFDLATIRLRFDEPTLYRAAVKYGRAIAHSAVMSEKIKLATYPHDYEIEVSVDETETPTSPLEHLFFGLELKRRGVKKLVSLAPRFVGEFEKGIDYRGDLKTFEASLTQHVAIAQYCGPYKISVHSGSDKFAAYPSIGRLCGNLLHVKTAGTSYLEALRVVARAAPSLFAEICAYSRGRFAEDRKSYHISTTEAEVADLPRFQSSQDEPPYLDNRPGRQLLHVTFGSVLTAGLTSKGRRFKEGILEILQKETALHSELLVAHFGKHLRLLNQG